MYELGYLINDERFIVWKGNEFPPYPMHDVIAASVRVLKSTLTNADVRMINEHNGQSYSY